MMQPIMQTYKTLRIIKGLIFSLVVCFPGIAAHAQIDLSSSLPRQIRQWKIEGRIRIFDRDTISGLIDSGSEIYLAYNFRQGYEKRFVAPDGSEIILDIFDMGSPPDAFGLFTSQRQSDDANIGHGSDYYDKNLRFWKGSFFVSIRTVGTTGGDKNAENAVLELGKIIEAALPSAGIEPDLIRFLPKTGLNKKSVRYFHSHHLLNKFYPLSGENILLLNNFTECVLASYPAKNNANNTRVKVPITVLLVKYESEDRAKSAYKNFLSIYMPQSGDVGIGQTKNKLWACAVVKLNILKIVLDAPDRTQAIEMYQAIKFL